MGSEHSRGSSGEPDKVEAHQAETEGTLGEQPARTPSSEMGNETAEAHSDGGSASQTVPQREEENHVSLPAEEPGPQENSPEGGRPPSPSQSVSSDKGHPAAGQTCELDTATPPAEHSSEKADRTAPQIPPEAAGEPEPEPGVTLLTSEGPSTDPESPRTAEDRPCSAESSAQKSPGEISPCPRTGKERDPEGSDCDEDSFEVITEAHPGPAASETADGHPDTTAAVEAQGSAGAESMTTKTVPCTQVGQGKGHSAVGARTTEEGQTASNIPEESDRECPSAQPALDALEKPLASHAVKHTDANDDKKSTNGIQNDGRSLTTEATSLGKGRPGTVVICDAEAGPLPDPEQLQDLDEAEERSFMKEMVETCSGLDAIELAEARVRMLSECPQPVHVTCTEVTLLPVDQKTQPVAAADVDMQLQGFSGTEEGAVHAQEGAVHAQEGAVHAQKQEARFPKTFYLCCSQCSDGEPNAEQ